MTICSKTAFRLGSAVALCATVAVIGFAQVIRKPTNASILIAPKIAETKVDKKAILAKAAGLKTSIAALMKVFTNATLTPRQPVAESAAFSLERAADFDPLRDLISFFGTSGNAYVRFKPGFTDRPYLIDFLISAPGPNPQNFEVTGGPGGQDTVGEGFVAVERTTAQVDPGLRHVTLVVFPKDERWYWVMLKSKTDGMLWQVKSAEISYLK